MTGVEVLIFQAVVAAGVNYVVGKIAEDVFAPSQSPRAVAPEKPVTEEVVPAPFIVDPLSVAPDPGGACIGIFGQRRVGGAVHVNALSTDEKTYIVIVIACEPVTAIDSVFIDDVLVSLASNGDVISQPWADGAINVKLYDGTQTTADAELMAAFPGWSADHVGHRVAYARIIVDGSVNPDAFRSGVPDFTFSVRGHPVYDPRDPAQDVDDPTTWQYSANAALINATYAIHPLGGAFPPNVIDWPSVASAASVCDESVTLADGGSEPRYTCAISWRTDVRKEEIEAGIGAAHAGGLYVVGRQFRMATGAATPSTAAIGVDDYGPEGLSWSDRVPIGQLANGVRGRFSSPLHSFELRDFPSYQDAAALAADAGGLGAANPSSAEIWLDLDLAAVTSPSQAQRLARIAYNRSRLGTSASVETNFAHFDVVANDTITITDAFAEFTAKKFRVRRESTDAEFYISLDLVAENDTFFAWNAATDEAPFTAGDPLGDVYGPGAGGGIIGGSGWTATRNPNTALQGAVYLYRMSFTDLGAVEYYVTGIRTTAPVSPGTYRVEVRSTGRRYNQNQASGNAIVDYGPDLSQVPAAHAVGFAVLQAYNSAGLATIDATIECRFVETTTGAATAWRTLYTIDQADARTNVVFNFAASLPASFNTSPTTSTRLLAAAVTPYVDTSDATTLTLKVDACPDVNVATLEILMASTSDPNTATVLASGANGSGGLSHVFTLLSSTTRFYWSRTKDSGGNPGPLSDVLQIAFA